MDRQGYKLYDLINTREPAAVFGEIHDLVSLVRPGTDARLLTAVMADVVRLYGGDYPGYRASNTKYHDLEHAASVALAAARLLHGAAVEGIRLGCRDLFLGLTAALFHDVGLIQEADDLRGSGAKHTIGHEARSVAFMRRYFREKGLSATWARDCAHIIRCTILGLPLDAIPFRSGRVKFLGQVVGTADLLAQMADRRYLEKLLLLFEEFQEAGLPGYATALELFAKTDAFYQNVVKARLLYDLGGVHRRMRSHFRTRWGIDQDLYETAITHNLDHLRSLLDGCENAADFCLSELKRGRLPDAGPPDPSD